MLDSIMFASAFVYPPSSSSRVLMPLRSRATGVPPGGAKGVRGARWATDGPVEAQPSEAA
ncbi:hypothetical protein Taro_018118 [Colocasia esculenta]|uniref:Uncharacterized protein n=1 Tax=Colocasia esculenta TaxID=4460 RepID=A0A843UY52_COLES|nr:hypothetical protein [Colocasia esculenta]